MSDEEKIALAIRSLIIYFQSHDDANGTAMAETARTIFTKELQAASTTLAGQLAAPEIESVHLLQ